MILIAGAKFQEKIMKRPQEKLVIEVQTGELMDKHEFIDSLLTRFQKTNKSIVFIKRILLRNTKRAIKLILRVSQFIRLEIFLWQYF